MSDTVIRVENLGKKYVLGHQQTNERYTALRDVIANNVKSFAHRIKSLSPHSTPFTSHSPNTEEFWALKDVSFEIKQGDRVGIIGRNGAGKSTLLKMLSRITEPTKGRISIKGRVASLLEVGTGFHPELTGRENIYLNGAILGMSKVEIRRKFDEIVAFAEVEKFLDTPVKRYSSGMYVRLAFAVAAHLEPEILVVDEVLAVGDAQFQQKCLGKMSEVSQEGRTVLFVSHNNSAISSLCSRGIVLNQGSIKLNASARQAIAYYSQQSNSNKSVFSNKEDRPSIRSVSIDEQLLAQGDLGINVSFDSPWALDPPLVGIVVSNILGNPLFGSNTWLDPNFTVMPMKTGCAKLRIKRIPLHSGSYKVSVWLGEKNQNYDSKIDAIQFDFISDYVLPKGLTAERIGAMNLPSSWEVIEALEKTTVRV